MTRKEVEDFWPSYKRWRFKFMDYRTNRVRTIFSHYEDEQAAIADAMNNFQWLYGYWPDSPFEILPHPDPEPEAK